MMTKTKIFAVCLAVALMQSAPARAVTEPVKMLQYSIRNVSKTVEVVQNLTALVTAIQTSILQGVIGAVKAEVKGTVEDFKAYAPTVVDDLKGAVKSANPVPQIRGYVEDELKNVNFDDVMEQRDALLDISKRLNVSSLEAISLGKQTAAKLNQAPADNDAMLKAAASAPDQQKKDTQEAAFGIKGLEEDALINQLKARQIEARAQRIIAEIKREALNVDTIVPGIAADEKGQEAKD